MNKIPTLSKNRNSKFNNFWTNFGMSKIVGNFSKIPKSSQRNINLVIFLEQSLRVGSSKINFTKSLKKQKFTAIHFKQISWKIIHFIKIPSQCKMQKFSIIIYAWKCMHHSSQNKHEKLSIHFNLIIKFCSSHISSIIYHFSMMKVYSIIFHFWLMRELWSIFFESFEGAFLSFWA
jgi:hypothetical protein